jgi:hypothetical protein
MIREQGVDPASPLDRVEIGEGQAVGEIEHALNDTAGSRGLRMKKLSILPVVPSAAAVPHGICLEPFSYGGLRPDAMSRKAEALPTR